jgi:leader peptidase (prepilin peptidase) / N-methyltransferase
VRIAVFALLGLVVGSFLTVVVHRVPRRESIVAPRSRCPGCGEEIRARDNVPVVSYLLLRGRCRHCGARISPEYPLIELATAALFAGAALRFEDPWAAGLVAPFLALMLALAIIDARHRIVPNRITYPVMPLFAAAILVGTLAGGGVDILIGLLGLALYAVPLLLLALAMPGGMGMGDVKLAALIGLVLGSLGLRYVAVAAGLGIIGGGIGALVAMIALGRGRKEHIPFGPFLAGGAGVAAFVAPQIASAYLSLLG